jgi:hypothetical protein
MVRMRPLTKAWAGEAEDATTMPTLPQRFPPKRTGAALEGQGFAHDHAPVALAAAVGFVTTSLR